MRFCIAVLVALAPALGAAAADAPTADKGKWVNISDPTTKQIVEGGKKIVWPGDTAGVTVDPSSGDLFMVVTGEGLWKSSDHGKTFARCDGGKMGGRCETSYSINTDPDGKHFACFMLDGHGALSLDSGKSWESMKDVGRNWDYAAVDWKNDGKNILALRHESGGEIYLSHDSGKSWSKIGKDEKFSAIGIVDEKTLLATKGDGVLRSTDDAATWNKVADFTPIGRVAKSFNGVLYWLAKEGLITSKDGGATWTKIGTPVEASIGPWFKDEKHIVVAGKKGFVETLDAGETWKIVAPLPEGFDVPRPGWFTNIAWDPIGDVFYASKMGKPTFKYER